MTKLNKLLTIALVAQLGVLIASRLVASSSEPAGTNKLLDGMKAKDVTAIAIEDGDGKQVRLQRQGKDKWVLASHGGYPAKAEQVTTMLGRLTSLQAGQPVADKPSHHRALEVADAEFQRKVTLTLAGDKQRQLYLGSSPAVKKVHLRFAGKDPVYLAGELSTWDVGATAGTWVDPEYFKVEREAVVAMSLRNEHGNIELSKGSDGQWTLAGLQADQKLSQSEVESLLGQASAVSLHEPVGRELKPAYGLQSPKARLAVVVQPPPKKAEKQAAEEAAATAPGSTPTRVTHELEVGTKHGDEGYYAKAASSDFVVLISTWNAEQLVDKKAADLLEKPEQKDGDESEGAAALPPGIPGMDAPHMPH